MAKFGLELHGSGGKVFIGSNTSNPEGQKYIGKEVISVNGSDSSIESIKHAFHAVGKNSRKITLILDGGTSIDILPQGIYQRFRNWFDGLSEGTYQLPTIDDPYFKTGLGVNPKTGKIRIHVSPRSSALGRIFDL